MAVSSQESERLAQVVAIASGQDPTKLRLTAAEGYLLSRIDGRTPWRLLREIGGIPAGDVDRCLERWLDQGIVSLVTTGSRPSAQVVGGKSPAAARAPMDAASVPPQKLPIDPSLLDPTLDIDCDVQRRILEFELSLARPYHELLGVAVGSDPKTVKRAYFKLSKEFHPDRYFRRDIGPYQQRLERIFKRVLEAHEILSDPELSQVVNAPDAMAAAVDPETTGIAANAAAVATDAKTVASAKSGVANGADPAASVAAGNPVRDSVAGTSGSGSPAAKPLSKLERLKQRMPFKIDQAALAARRARAAEIFRAAEASLAAGRLHEAEANIRIAISFDPLRAEFKEALGALRIRAAGDRAAKLLATPLERMSDVELRDALRLIEDVLPYRPHDPDLNLRAAQVNLQLGQYDQAVEFVETLIEGAPDVASHHALRGRIERAKGDLKAAKQAFEAAIELDPEDLEARKALASMRIAAFDAARGGRR